MHTLGHNSLAYFTYMGTGLLTLFQVITGFALYAPMSEFWFPHLFDWVVPLVRQRAKPAAVFHYVVLWFFAVFTLVHVYLVFYHDYVEGHGVLSSMVGGWKFMETEKIEAEEASGISGFTTATRTGKPRPAPGAADHHRRADPMAGLLDNTLVANPRPARPRIPTDFARVLVLGVGNLLMGDEGVGVHVMRLLEQESPPEGVRVLDGGTGGINLLLEFERVSDIVLIDATRDGQRPAASPYLQPRTAGELPRGLGAHDFGLKDLFAVSALSGPDCRRFTC